MRKAVYRTCHCGSRVYSKGLCPAHYAQQYRAAHERKPNGVCLCGQPAFRKGQCDRCYRAGYRAAHAKAPRRDGLAPKPTVCEADGKPVVAAGLCSACYQQRRRGRMKGWDEPGVVDWLSAYPVPEWPTFSEEEKSKRLDALVDIYKSKGFPWKLLPTEADPLVLSKVARGKINVGDDSVSSVGWSGQAECLLAHPHRYEVSYRGYESVVEAFQNEATLRKAISFQLKVGDPVTPKRVLRALSALLKGPTNFPPVLARWLVDTYAPENGVILDPCAGFGGRLLGAIASRKNVSYVGFDPEPLTVAGNNLLASRIGASHRASVRQSFVEDTETPWPKAALLIACPPYFDRENYGEASSQILTRYRDLEEWNVGFLRTLVRRGLDAAPKIAICVSSYRNGSRRIDLPGTLRAILVAEGTTIEKEWKYVTSKFGTNRRFETIFVATR